MNAGDNAIALIGFMGAGKSAVGRELSRRTGRPRHDTDEMIREQFGTSIPDIFARHGEPAFRDAETALLETLRRRLAGIVVTGGGIILREENVRILRGMGRIIWLDADEEILWQRASRHSTRPLLQTPDPRARFAGDPRHLARRTFRDLPSCCGNDYRAIRRRRIIASTPHAAASRQ